MTEYDLQTGSGLAKTSLNVRHIIGISFGKGEGKLIKKENTRTLAGKLGRGQ